MTSHCIALLTGGQDSKGGLALDEQPRDDGLLVTPKVVVVELGAKKLRRLRHDRLSLWLRAGHRCEWVLFQVLRVVR